MRKDIWILVWSVWLLLGSVQAMGQAADPVVSSNKSGYLLLDKGLQYRITKSINSMYNFDFPLSLIHI